MNKTVSIRKLKKREDIGFFIMSLIMFVVGVLSLLNSIFGLIRKYNYNDLSGIFLDTITIICFIIYFVLFILRKDGKYWVAISFSIYNLNMFAITSYFYIVPIFTLPVSILLFSIASKKDKHLLFYFILLCSGYFLIIYLQSCNIIPVEAHYAGLRSGTSPYLFFILFLTSFVGIFALVSKALRLKEEYGAVLRDLNRQKTNFFINFAHETKTPLTLILNYLDRYMKSQKEESEELKIVRMNLQKLTIDMENYLDAEKIERGIELYINDKVFNFSGLLSGEIELFTETAARKGITLDSSVEKNIIIKAHDSAICRVVRNFLDNAVKYTPKGGRIKVTLAVLNDSIIFTVCDSGIGIPREQLENIFKPYFQISGRKQNYQGSGMGLCITKKIVDELQGKLEIESTVNKGTTVKAVFPVYQLNRTEEADDFDVPRRFNDNLSYDLKEEAANPDLPTILIVEDEAGIISLLKSELKSNYNLYYALNGKEALEKLPEVVPDLIISDVMMDVMDGFDFISQIPDAFRIIPFIFLTARTGLSDKLKGLDRGAVDYVSKPFVMEEVRHKIKNHLEKREQIKNSVFKKMEEFISGKPPVKTSLTTFCLHQGITQKEKQVILLVNDGLQNKEIAFEMNITENTVKSHLNTIFNKLQVTNRVGIVKKIRDIDLST